MTGIIIPTYKALDTLPHALDSLLTQTKKMFLVCISVDGDQEDYTKLLEEYRARGLKILFIRSEENRGPGMARQAGINAMAPLCDYIMFLDSDDLLMPQAVERLYEEAKRNAADVIQSSVVADATLAPDRIMEADKTPVTWTHGKIYRTKYLTENHIEFVPEIRYNEDSYFNVVAMNSTKNKFTLNEITYYWSDNPNSLTRKDPKKFFEISWENYILSQVRGMERINELLPSAVSSELLGLTSINLYWHYIQARHYGFNEDLAKSYLAEWKSIPVFQEKIADAKFWNAVAHQLKGCMIISKTDIVFPKQNFADWVTQYIKE